MRQENQYTQFAVLGMGRFGLSVVEALAESDVSVLACDRESGPLQRAAEYATHVVKADISDEQVLEELNLGSFDVVIIATGEDFEAAVIATMIAKEQGAGYVLSKAKGKRQKVILERMGADQVVLPEHDMGARIARNLVGSNIMDFLEASEDHTILELRPREHWVGKSIKQADIRKRENLHILAVRRGDKLTIPVSPDYVLSPEDVLIVLSEKQ